MVRQSNTVINSSLTFFQFALCFQVLVKYTKKKIWSLFFIQANFHLLKNFRELWGLSLLYCGEAGPQWMLINGLFSSGFFARKRSTLTDRVWDPFQRYSPMLTFKSSLPTKVDPDAHCEKSDYLSWQKGTLVSTSLHLIWPPCTRGQIFLMKRKYLCWVWPKRSPKTAVLNVFCCV